MVISKRGKAVVELIRYAGVVDVFPQHAALSVLPSNPAIVADISLWEFAMLVAGGKLKLQYPVRDWRARLRRRWYAWPKYPPHIDGAVLLTNDAFNRSAGLVEVV